MPDTSPADRPLSILAVEDDLAQGRALGIALTRFGHRVTVAPDGASAVRAVFARAPDAVLMDLGLPDRDGYEVARDLCCLLKRRPVLVALTGAAGQEAKCREEGFDLCVRKPADPRALSLTLSGLVRLAGEPAADRRAAGRRAASQSARVFLFRGKLDLGHNLAAGLADLSATGARVLLSQRVEPGQDVYFRVEGRPHVRALRRPGRVVWCQPSEGGWQAGVHFHAPLLVGEVHKFT